jgi:microcystin-dependent protein
MPDSSTPNLSLTLPEIASGDTWGTKLNAGLTTLDAIFKADGTGTSVGLNVGTGKTLMVAGVSIGALISNAINAALPIGAIMLWSGSAAAIPAGWALCNGTGGTPDLRDRFLVGAGGSYAVGATGGSANASLVAHSHTVSASGTTSGSGGHSHSVNDPGHSHTNTTGSQILSNGTAVFLSGYNNDGTTSAAATGISVNGVGDHTHSVSVSGSTSADGSSATNANLPPFYALCYIMKV